VEFGAVWPSARTDAAIFLRHAWCGKRSAPIRDSRTIIFEQARLVLFWYEVKFLRDLFDRRARRRDLDAQRQLHVGLSRERMLCGIVAEKSIVCRSRGTPP